MIDFNHYIKEQSKVNGGAWYTLKPDLAEEFVAKLVMLGWEPAKGATDPYWKPFLVPPEDYGLGKYHQIRVSWNPTEGWEALVPKLQRHGLPVEASPIERCKR